MCYSYHMYMYMHVNIHSYTTTMTDSSDCRIHCRQPSCTLCVLVVSSIPKVNVAKKVYATHTFCPPSGHAEEAQLPYFDLLPNDPTLEEVRRLVCVERRRPSLPNPWNQHEVHTTHGGHCSMQEFIAIQFVM